MQIADHLARVSKSVGLRRGLRIHNLTNSPVILLVWTPTLRTNVLYQLVHRAGRWPPEMLHLQVTALTTKRDSP